MHDPGDENDTRRLVPIGKPLSDDERRHKWSEPEKCAPPETTLAANDLGVAEGAD